MAHECEECGMLCYCDCDDLGGLRQPNTCPHFTHPEKYCAAVDDDGCDDWPEED
jgi:hypothetical protein